MVDENMQIDSSGAKLTTQRYDLDVTSRERGGKNAGTSTYELKREYGLGRWIVTDAARAVSYFRAMSTREFEALCRDGKLIYSNDEYGGVTEDFEYADKYLGKGSGELNRTRLVQFLVPKGLDLERYLKPEQGSFSIGLGPKGRPAPDGTRARDVFDPIWDEKITWKLVKFID